MRIRAVLVLAFAVVLLYCAVWNWMVGNDVILPFLVSVPPYQPPPASVAPSGSGTGVAEAARVAAQTTVVVKRWWYRLVPVYWTPYGSLVPYHSAFLATLGLLCVAALLRGRIGMPTIRAPSLTARGGGGRGAPPSGGGIGIPRIRSPKLRLGLGPRMTKVWAAFGLAGAIIWTLAILTPGFGPLVDALTLWGFVGTVLLAVTALAPIACALSAALPLSVRLERGQDERKRR